MPEDSAAMNVLVPAVGAVTLAALGVAAAKACCGVRLRTIDPYRVIPTGLALLTAGAAAYSYLSESQEHDKLVGFGK